MPIASFPSPLRASIFAALLCSLASAGQARAQVNAEGAQTDLFGQGWSAGLDGSFSLARGNVELIDVGAGARIQFQRLHRPVPPKGPKAPLPFIAQRLFLVGDTRFAERAGSPFINRSYMHLRWTAMWHRRVGSELFVQYQFNEFLRLRARAVAGTGVRVELVHRPIFLLWGGSGYMLEYNRIDVEAGAPDAPETFEHRWTSYLSMRLALFQRRLLVQNTLYVQPRFDSLGDFRLLEEVEVLGKITEVLALGMSFVVLHDSAPPTGVRPTDLRLASTIKLSF